MAIQGTYKHITHSNHPTNTSMVKITRPDGTEINEEQPDIVETIVTHENYHIHFFLNILFQNIVHYLLYYHLIYYL